MTTLLKFGLTGALLLLLIWQCRFAASVLLSDISYFQVQREMVYWGEAGNSPGIQQVAVVEGQLESIVALWAEHPDYLALQARIQGWYAVLAPYQQRSSYLEKALELMQHCLALRPGNPYSWAQYAEYLSALPGRDAELAMAVEKAITLAPGDQSLEIRMLRLKPQ